VFSSLIFRGRIQETGDRIQEKETWEEKTASVSSIPSPVFSSLIFRGRIQEKETWEEKTASVSSIPSPVFSSLIFRGEYRRRKHGRRKRLLSPVFSSLQFQMY
jgi:hypothetical protein